MKWRYLSAFGLFCISLSATAQLTIGGTRPIYDSRTNTYMLTVPETAFGGAYQAPVVIDSGVTSVKIDGHEVTSQVTFPLVVADTSYTFVFKKDSRLTQSTIHFTYLPIMCITGTFSNSYVVAPVEITFPDGQGVQSYRARIKQAGTSTNLQWIYKRNYHVKFVDENGEKMDVSFFGLRNDNHWRLDAGTRDMIRFRNYAANGLWADFGTKSYYADKQSKALSYVRGSHVEVFMNGAYHGFYNFHEFLDRKQMKLKKYEEVIDEDNPEQSSVQFHGMMWKGADCTPQTLFLLSGSVPDNTKERWCGYELEYPELDDVFPTDYSVLYNAVKFVARSNDYNFNRQVGDYFDLPVVADYLMFLHVVFGIDNADNNMVLACYDQAVDKKITFAVWDLDATVGQHYLDIDGYYHADEIQPENELEDVPNNMCMFKSNKLFNRLKAIPQFYRMVVNRYWQLRENVLHPDSLVERYQAIYRRLDACGALDRESQRWSGTDEIDYRTLDFPAELEYLCDWLRRRIAYLDTHTFACRRGDVNDDGKVGIDDITALINYLLAGAPTDDFNDINADVDADNLVNISDVTSLINLLLSS